MYVKVSRHLFPCSNLLVYIYNLNQEIELRLVHAKAYNFINEHLHAQISKASITLNAD